MSRGSFQCAEQVRAAFVMGLMNGQSFSDLHMFGMGLVRTVPLGHA